MGHRLELVLTMGVSTEVVAAGDYVERVARTLPSAWTADRRKFDGREVLIARRKDFRWRWMAVQLTTTLVVGEQPASADRDALDKYLGAAVREASARGLVKGLGYQRGAAAVAVAVFAEATPAAIEWATKTHGQKFAVVAYPVMVDLATRTVTQPERMIAGRVFHGFLRSVVDETVAAALAG